MSEILIFQLRYVSKFSTASFFREYIESNILTRNYFVIFPIKLPSVDQKCHGVVDFQALQALLNANLVPTSSSTFAELLDLCISSSSGRDVLLVHARIIKSQFSCETFINNRLIDAYGKCNRLNYARKVFDTLPDRNTFTYNVLLTALMKWSFLDEAKNAFEPMVGPDQCTWNSMISGFYKYDCFQEAVEYFTEMHSNCLALNEYSYASALSSCSGLLDLRMGLQIHGLVSKTIYAFDVYMGSALIDMYAKCGDVESARSVFDGMDEKNIVSWNSLITCYEQNGPASKAIDVFVKLMECGFGWDEVTLASVVSACASLSWIKEGLQIQAHVFKMDTLRDDIILNNALVDMYAKCGRINQARWVFDRLPKRNVTSDTTLVRGYAKAASVKEARQVFAKMNERNVVSWNALIAGYTQKGENEEALRLFLLLKRESVWPTHYTFGNLINACANLSDLQLGRQAHTNVLKHGFQFQSGPDTDIFVGNSLIDMYMKCGSVHDGFQVFQNMIDRDCVSWNAMIVGYAQNGYANEALTIFRRMLESSEKPDHVTMVGVLSACGHAGMVDEGQRYFQLISNRLGLKPTKDHYTCMVDLLGRAGCLDEAKELIESMPMQYDAVTLGSLLGACKVHGNIEMGKFVAEKLLEIDPSNSGPYVLLSNMYAELGRWRDVGRIRKLMRQSRVVKQPGCSWIEMQGNVHVFMVKDKSHPLREEIYLLLKMLLKQLKRSAFVENVADFEHDSEPMSCCLPEMVEDDGFG